MDLLLIDAVREIASGTSTKKQKQLGSNFSTFCYFSDVFGSLLKASLK